MINGIELFDIYPKDLEGRRTWCEAKEACAKLGDGWRLPTKDELNEIYGRKDTVVGLTNFSYWSSTEYDNHNAWKQNLGSGSQSTNYKNYINYVRAVRTLTI